MPTKNYFNEKQFSEWMKDFPKYQNQIAKAIYLIAGAIVNKKTFYISLEPDDLKQHAVENVLKALPKFSPTKGTYFNYITRVATLSMMNLIERTRKKNDTVSIGGLEEHLIVDDPVLLFDKMGIILSTMTDSKMVDYFVEYMKGDSFHSLQGFQLSAIKDGYKKKSVESFIREVKTNLRS